MALLQKKISVAAGATTGNVFSGSEYEFLARPATLTVSAVGSAAGVTMRWSSGSVVLVDDAEFTSQASGTTFPIIPDNILDAELVPAGDRNILTFTNPGSAAVDVYYRIDIDWA